MLVSLHHCTFSCHYNTIYSKISRPHRRSITGWFVSLARGFLSPDVAKYRDLIVDQSQGGLYLWLGAFCHLMFVSLHHCTFSCHYNTIYSKISRPHRRSITGWFVSLARGFLSPDVSKYRDLIVDQSQGGLYLWLGAFCHLTLVSLHRCTLSCHYNTIYSKISRSHRRSITRWFVSLARSFLSPDVGEFTSFKISRPHRRSITWWFVSLARGFLSPDVCEFTPLYILVSLQNNIQQNIVTSSGFLSPDFDEFTPLYITRVITTQYTAKYRDLIVDQSHGDLYFWLGAFCHLMLVSLHHCTFLCHYNIICSKISRPHRRSITRCFVSLARSFLSPDVEELKPGTQVKLTDCQVNTAVPLLSLHLISERPEFPPTLNLPHLHLIKFHKRRLHLSGTLPNSIPHFNFTYCHPLFSASFSLELSYRYRILARSSSHQRVNTTPGPRRDTGARVKGTDVSGLFRKTYANECRKYGLQRKLSYRYRILAPSSSHHRLDNTPGPRRCDTGSRAKRTDVSGVFRKTDADEWHLSYRYRILARSSSHHRLDTTPRPRRCDTVARAKFTTAIIQLLSCT
ncbi:hypothetical protein J6590_019065 [Homalodisca vitripennis]|nr:hypothetical protein J6590_019065 [Homalodisca vitripennis]